MAGVPMKVWFTAAEFAELAASGELPDLPATKRGVNLLAAREGWDRDPALCRPRVGRTGGGGLEYHVDNLPMPTRVAWAARHFRAAAEDIRPQIDERDGLTARGREERDARIVIVNLADRFRSDNGLSIAAADHLFAQLYNAGRADVPAWVTAKAGTASARSIARWRAARSAGRTVGFDRSLARKGTASLERAEDGRVRIFVLAAIAKLPFLSAKDVRDSIVAEFPGFDTPPLRTIQQTLSRWREDYRNELLLLTDPDRYRSAVEFSATNATRADRLNQVWQIDASPADAMLKEGRHSIYLAIDVYSRRTKVLVTRTPRAAGVGLLMRKCILDWGLPEKVKTDNGSDFKARATTRLFAGLGIEVELSPPYQPRAKGMVERAIGTFQRDLAGLPGFIGHSVADRKVIENRRAFHRRLGADPAELFEVDMDLADFQQWCDDWTETIYATTPHAGLGGRTPFAAVAAYAGTVRRVADASALDMLLAEVPGKDGLRTVTKTGIRIDGAHYLTASAMPGTTVFCRMDPADLGKVLMFEPDGETFVGVAVCPELAGLDPVATIQRVRAEQKAYMDGRVAPIRQAMRKIGPRQVADAMRAAGQRRQGNLVAFPTRSETHSTPALDAAARAARPDEPSPAPASAAPAFPPEPKVVALPETREQRFRRALDIEARMARGEPVEGRELLWLGGYRETSEARAMRQMLDEFGADAMRL